MKTEQSKSVDLAAAKALEAEVWELIGQNQLRPAAEACEKLNRQYPDFGSGWHTASQLASKLNNPKGALAAIEKALSIDPQSIDWRLQRAMCHGRLNLASALAADLAELSSRQMESAYQCSALGMLLSQSGEREAAVKHYQKATELEPGDARHFYNLACLQRTLGSFSDAETNFDEAIRINPADFESYKLRSDLRQQTSERNHVAELERLLSGGISDARGMVHIAYAVAKELEDLGESDRSFAHLKAGSDQRRKLMKYDVARDLETIAAIRQAFSADVFSSAASGIESAEPIFVLGLPRTGTTLVERILASHTEVFAAGELNNFAMQLTNMLHARSLEKKMSRDELVASSAQLDFAALGDAYLRSTRPFTGHTSYFIDKMPLNFLYVGLIRLALPNARVVNLQRDPMDTCYAIYKQLFVDAYPFSYDLQELGKYYVAYRQLMEHWNAVLPGAVHTVRYEDLVKDLEGESRHLLEFCGLEWQPQCLKFHKNREASTTASTAQIRRPIYSTSIGKWRSFSKHLKPLVNILEEAGYG